MNISMEFDRERLFNHLILSKSNTTARPLFKSASYKNSNVNYT